MWCSSNNSVQLDATNQCAAICTGGERVAVASGNSVNVHLKNSLRELLQLNFESAVNAVCWAGKEERFLLVAEHSGYLHTVHVKSERVINCERVYQTFNDVSSTVTQLLYAEDASMLFILGSGSLHCFRNLDYVALDQALCEGKLEKAASLKQQICHTSLSVSPTATCLVLDFNKQLPTLYILGSEECMLSKLIYDKASHDWLIDADVSLYGYGNIRSAFKVTPQYLLTLTDKSCLILWSVQMCTAVRVWAYTGVEQMAPLNLSPVRLSDCTMVVYGKGLAGKNISSVAIVTLPALEIVFSQNVDSCVIAQDYTSLLSVHYVDGSGGFLQLTTIDLVSFQSRYEAMISKQNYDEALLFAKMNDLDTQMAYKAKAVSLSSNLTVQTVDGLRFCLDKIEETHTVVDICTQSVSSIPKIVKEAMKYALRRLQMPAHSKCTCDRVAQIIRSLQCLKTYTTVFESFTSVGWKHFLACDLPAEVLRLASSESVSSAMKIWTRHKGELCFTLTPDWLDSLLGHIDQGVDWTELSDWLKDHVIPVVLRNKKRENYSSVIVKHVERLAIDYELCHKEKWPDNSLQLCSIVNQLTSVASCPNLNRLKFLRENLLLIKELKDVYNCSLSYSLFCEQSRESIVYRLLDVVAVPSLFKHHYETVAKPYMRQYRISSDTNLLNYIKDLIGRYQYIRGYDSTGLLWEQKAVEVVACISHPTYQVAAVTELARHCQVPYSKCISDAVERVCQLTTEDVEELNDIRKRSLLTHLLSLYNVSREIIPSASNSLMLIRFILKQTCNSLPGLQHALQVADALQVEPHLVYQYAVQGRLMCLTDVQDIMVDIPSDIACKVLHYIVNMCIELFAGHSFCDWSLKSHWAEITISLLRNYDDLFDENYFPFSLSQLTNQIESLMSLKREFDIEVNFLELSSPESLVHHVKSLFHKLVVQKIDSSQDESSQVKVISTLLSHNWWRLLRFAQLTNLPKFLLYELVCDKAYQFSPHSVSLVLRTLLEEDCSCDAISFAIQKLTSFLSSGNANVNNAKELYSIAEFCVTHCTEDELLEASRLLTLTKYHCDVMSNCLGGDDEQDMMSSQIDKADAEALFTRKYHTEKDLIISTHKVAQQTCGLMQYHLTPPSDACSETDILEVFDEQYSQLTSTSHDLLAIRTCLLVYYSSVTAHDSSPECVKIKHMMSRKLKHSVDSLLSKLFSLRNLDVHLLLSTLTDLPITSSLSLVKKNASSSGSQFLRVLSLTNIASVLCLHGGQGDYLRRCVSLKTEAIWGYLLSKCGVNFLPVFGKPNKGELLDQMARKCSNDVIKRYLKDFNLLSDSQLAHLSKIQHLVSLHNERAFWKSCSKGDELLKEIETLLKEASLETKVIDSLVDCCNPYNYSLMLIFFTLTHNTQRLKLLNFLQLYKRYALPSDFEVAYIQGYYANRGDNYVPEVAFTRLPYHPLVNGQVWKVIRPELCVKTFKVLEPIASLLQIKNDSFMLNVALQITKTHIGLVNQKNAAIADSDDADNWYRDEDVDSKFFHDITAVLAAISDKKSAVMCSQSLIDKVPVGVEKILVAKLCIDLTRSWLSSLQQDSEDRSIAESSLKKVAALHSLLSVEKCLNQFNLASDKLLQLIEHPSQLIQAVLETTHTDSSHRAEEKFEACCMLASITGRDITKLCYNIVSDSWLAVEEKKSRASLDMDMTMTIDMAAVMASETDDSTKASSVDDSVKERWIVNLANTSIGHKIVHLLNSLLNSISTDNKTKLLVVRCLLMLCDTSFTSTNQKSPSEQVKLTPEQLNRQYEALKYIDRLRDLNINMSVEEFYSCDLSALIAKLRKNYSSSPVAVNLYADLCIEINCYDVVTWRHLLHQLVELKMVTKLADILPTLPGHTQLWSLDVYRKAWQLLVDGSASQETGSVCKTALLSCPVMELLQIHL